MNEKSKKPVEKSIREAFDLTRRVAIITGGAGLLGCKHGEAVAEMGGIPILIDVDKIKVESVAEGIKKKYNSETFGWIGDVTSQKEIQGLKTRILEKFGRIDILINNAANNPSMSIKGASKEQWSRLEKFPLDLWEKDIAVGLTGAFLCSQIFGSEMARMKCGVILNIGSDLGMIGPDQRVYQKEGLSPDEQPVKPVTYSVTKAGLIGLTRYIATYWADKGVRANLIAPGGVYTNQDPIFVEKISKLIPLGRMAHQDEYKSAIAFLVSDASSYMNGAILSVDGGRTSW
jgi:NAD(P)-dependent dehydrogenase (short-subunit alcohol dehydrogenase family)